MRLVEDLRLDSIRLLTLAAEVENRFRVILDEEDELRHRDRRRPGRPRGREAASRLTCPVSDSPPAATLLDLLARGGRRPDGGLRFLDRDERATWVGWAEVRERALAVARRPAARSASAPGDRVALVFPTGPEFFDAFFGALARRRGAGAALPAGAARAGSTSTSSAPRACWRWPAPGWCSPTAGSRRVLGEVVAARPPAPRLPHARRAAGASAPSRRRSRRATWRSSSSPPAPRSSPSRSRSRHRAVVAQVRSLNSFLAATLRELRDSGVSLAAALPRHGAHRLRLPGPRPRRQPHPDRPRARSSPARPSGCAPSRATARTISPAPNFAYALCATRIRDAEMEGVDLSSWRPRPQRRRAGGAAGAARLRRALRPLGLPARGADPGLRPLRGGARRHLLRARPAVREPAVRARGAGARGAGAWTTPRGARSSRSAGRCPASACAIRDEAGRDAARAPGRTASGSPGPSLMEGYLDDPEATAARPARRLARHRRPRLPRRRRAVPDRPRQGRRHPARPQLRAGGDRARASTASRACAPAARWRRAGCRRTRHGEALVLFVERRRGRRPPRSSRRCPRPAARPCCGATGLAVDEVVVLPPGTLPRTSSGKLRRAEALRLWLAGELAPPEPVTPLRLADGHGALGARLRAAARRRGGDSE